jgi:hypothetical protein
MSVSDEIRHGFDRKRSDLQVGLDLLGKFQRFFFVRAADILSYSMFIKKIIGTYGQPDDLANQYQICTV